MPIVDVDIVLKPGESLPERLADLLAHSISLALRASPGRTWVKLMTIDHQRYAEDSTVSGRSISPIFVHVLKSAPPRGEELAGEVLRLTEAVAEICGRPAENVHVIYAPAARGRIAFGGEIMG